MLCYSQTIAAKFQLATNLLKNRIFHMPESFISEFVQYFSSVLCVLAQDFFYARWFTNWKYMHILIHNVQASDIMYLYFSSVQIKSPNCHTNFGEKKSWTPCNVIKHRLPGAPNSWTLEIFCWCFWSALWSRINMVAEDGNFYFRKTSLGTGFSACNCLFDSRNCLLTLWN